MSKSLYAIALHEAGHAVAAHCLGLRVRSATITPDDGSLASVGWERADATAFAEVIALLAGEIAESLDDDGTAQLPSDNSRGDRGKARELVDQIGPSLGVHRSEILATGHRRAVVLVNAQRPVIEYVASRLMEECSLYDDELRRDIDFARRQWPSWHMPDGELTKPEPSPRPRSRAVEIDHTTAEGRRLYRDMHRRRLQRLAREQGMSPEEGEQLFERWQREWGSKRDRTVTRVGAPMRVR